MRLVNTVVNIITLSCVFNLITCLAQLRNMTNVSENYQMVNAGITTTLTEKFYDAYREEVMKYFEQNLNGMKLADISREYTVGLAKMIIDFTD